MYHPTMSRSRTAPVDAAEALTALNALDPGVPRDTWIEISMAAKAAGVSYADWHAWCRRADNYGGESDCRAVWKSIKPDGGIGPGTLFRLAQEAGWTPPEKRPAPIRSAGRKRPHRPAATARSDQADTAPTDTTAQPGRQVLRLLLDAASPAPTTHPYLVRKGIPEAAARLYVLPDTKVRELLGYQPFSHRQNGPLRGSILLVPLQDEHGDLRSIELIDEAGLKVVVAGLPRKGLFWLAAPLPSYPDRIGICEGMATAATLHAATGEPIAAAGGYQFIRAVAEALGEQYPHAELVIYPDRGDAQAESAREIARETLSSVVIPPGDLAGTDYNDMAAERGLEAVREWIASHCDRMRLRLTAIAERGPIHIPEVLTGLPLGTLGMLMGQGAVGKTMLTLELAAGIGLGRDLFGASTFLSPALGKPARVNLLLGEDSRAQIHNRFHRVIQTLQLDDVDLELLDRTLHPYSLDAADMRVIEAGFGGKDLNTGAFHRTLRRICRSAALTIVDPLVRLHDSDENDNAAASALMLALAQISAETNCAILVLHHVSKAGGSDWRSARGASAYTTACRWVAKLSPAGEDDQLAEPDRAVKAELVKHNYCAPQPALWLERGPHGVLRFDRFVVPQQPAAAGDAVAFDLRGIRDRARLGFGRDRSLGADD